MASLLKRPAKTVFHDDRAVHADDPDEEEEGRFIRLGLSAGLRTLVVRHGSATSGVE